MDFPGVFGVRVEMAFGANPSGDPASWSWTDVSADLLSQPIGIERGRQDEMSHVQSSAATVTLDNTRGDYTPGRTGSPIYPNVVLGVPMRIWADLPPELLIPGVVDEFQREVPDGFGVADSGQPWRIDAAGTLYKVTGGVASISPTGPSAGRSGQFLPGNYGDVDVQVAVSPGQVTANGAFIGGLAYRAADGNNTYIAQPMFWNTGLVDLRLTYAGTIVQNPVSTGLRYAAGSWFWLRARAIGHRHQVKMWPLNAPEPAEWLIDVRDNAVPNPALTGGIGLTQSGEPAGAPVIRYDHLSARPVEPRWFGYVSEWAPTWPHGDLSNPATGDPGHALIAVTGAGVLRRLGQGAAPVQSMLRREILSDPARAPVAYWPCEDSAGASSFASATGGPPLTFDAGLPLASYTGVASSAPIPVTKHSRIASAQFGGTWPVTDQVRLITLIHMPPGGVRATAHLWRLSMTGSATVWDVMIKPDGAVFLRVLDAGLDLIVESAPIGFSLNGKTALLSLWLRQQGNRVRWQVADYESGADSVLQLESTLSGRTLGSVDDLQIDPAAAMDEVAFGHVALLNKPDFFDATIMSALNGRDGEKAGYRLRRLAAEERIPLTLIGSPDDTRPMGPQASGTLLALLRECADADGGILAESKSNGGLDYRTRASMLNQPPKLALDASRARGDIVNPFTPVLDDQAARNDITVTRRGGSSARITDPADIARRGHYDEQLTLNIARDDHLAAIAAWLLRLGTWPGMRYPTVGPALNNDPALLARWLQLELGDRVTITGLPPQHPDGTVSLLAQGYTETIRPTRWDAVINASPAGPWQT
ncbi:hypothetical protein [Amycolatopsis sp. NPDC059657]|uniref:hypothetical protein n=1 Tax=Amycolatopsis sp. NPDC059657 TaxID=3346899 RepID=UPI00366D254A